MIAKRCGARLALAGAVLAFVSAAVASPTTALFSSTQSATSSLEAAPVFPPVNGVIPLVTGLTTQGQTLTTDDGTWVSTETPTYAYQWQRCTSALATDCTNVSGATAKTYVLQAADVGSYMRSRVRATNSGGSADAHSLTTLVVLGL